MGQAPGAGTVETKDAPLKTGEVFPSSIEKVLKVDYFCEKCGTTATITAARVTYARTD